MKFQNCLTEAIDVVLSWDLPEECFADALTVQAGLMARMDPEDIQGSYSD